MRGIYLIIWAFLFGFCTADQKSGQIAAQPPAIPADTVSPVLNPVGKTVETRFPVPEGYVRMPTDSTSFAAYLRGLPLLPDSHQVRLYDGTLKSRQDVHAAVLDLDVGSRDLQQCADAVMRLRAEYLFAQKRYADIHFNFTNGFRADYDRWRRGDRIRVQGNRVSWTGGGAPSGSYSGFRKYLTQVFMYAGTASLERELVPVALADIQPGDVWIRGGHPGHAVIVLDVAADTSGTERRFLLAQSYMPAQEIHVLRNPADPDGGPWYSTAAIGDMLVTPEWVFSREHLRRFAGE
ncbi:MAG: hypothetical protein EP344_00985 [Bacteroidetes bacterium]|nr:MAG: hypothetical protein EP344_00985 [Bacteroidota bacterium]